MLCTKLATVQGGCHEEALAAVHQPAVPPVPVIVGVRYGAHSREGYDRIVFDIRGALPGYPVGEVAGRIYIDVAA